MTLRLTVYMLPHRYSVLSRALYGKEYGFGERVLQFDMVSGQDNLDIKIPVLCQYMSNQLVLIAQGNKDD